MSLSSLYDQWKNWRQERLIRSIAKELLVRGFDVNRPDTLHAIIDEMRANAVANGRTVRDIDGNIDLFIALAKMLEQERSVSRMAEPPQDSQ